MSTSLFLSEGVPRMDIPRVIAYIEENLAENDRLSVPVLAAQAGYSEFHFIRLFRDTVGLTPADYIRKRRISEIVMHIGGSRPMSDIAFEYGFNSKENFTRAFKKEHGILPSEYKKANSSLRLYAPFEQDSEFPKPDVSLAYIEGFELTVYPFGDDYAPHSWNTYNAEKRSLKLTGGRITEDFGVMYRDPDGRLIYSIGVRSSDAGGDTSGTEKIAIASGLYAVFQTQPSNQHDFISVIHRTWDWIYAQWLPASGYVRNTGYEMESYTESGRTYSEKIYVPITRNEKETQNG